MKDKSEIVQEVLLDVRDNSMTSDRDAILLNILVQLTNLNSRFIHLVDAVNGVSASLAMLAPPQDDKWTRGGS